MGPAAVRLAPEHHLLPDSVDLGLLETFLDLKVE